MIYESDATRHNVKSYETRTIFNSVGDVIYSVGFSLDDAPSLAMTEKAAAALSEPARMAVTLNGSRSAWYAWDGEMFICE